MTKKKPKRKSAKEKTYKHPIPGRGELLAKLTELGRPLKTDQLMAALGLKGQKTRNLLVEQLQKMLRAGQIIENRRGEYCLTEKLELVAGTVLGHRDGFGFVRRDDGGDDVYLSAREMRSVFDGDRVALRVVGLDRRGRAEGRVVEVLERGVREIAGQFILERGIGIVVPDNPKISHRILIPKEDFAAARPGQMVIAEILDYPTDIEQPTGRIISVIGAPDKKGIATDIAIHSHAIPNSWPKAVRAEAKAFGKSIPASAIGDRLDLRDVALVTIDGADARDFDDAVYCEPSGNGWRLIVAIADVAHYVQVESPIDKEAIRRGTSVYFPDRVVPMLPEVLSNGLCSLNPKVDRLCMVCDMKVDADGKVGRSRFAEAVMRSQARLTYTEVGEFLSDGKARAIASSLQQPLTNLHNLFKVLIKARQRRGAIELDIPQTRISLDEDGTIREIVAVERNDAHRLIEECMIAANVQAAKFLRKHRIAGLYRVHAKPDPDRFDELRQYLLGLGLKVPHPDHVEPREFNKMLKQVEGRPDSQAISMAMLRSLMHAEYTPTNIGHFGLSLDAYAHFTSPIRRYPDLLVHRAIRHILRTGKAGSYHYDSSAMERLGAVCSAHERRAEEATREVEAWLKCQFMEDKVGQTYSGVITGVTSFGAFVQIPEMQIDGLVHVTSLANDYYHYEAASQALVGERSGTRYRLGDKLKVSVARVDLDTRRIDFSLVEDAAATKQRGPSRMRRGGKR
ncbi:MAG: ribonuclease R [Gammaproteobacteria bacterium]|nr:ribonuclease R [Gammaproteobacteria bacterium]MDH4316077.1 ribonuclease R [Gammaproteobacteria bacterium]